MTARCKIWYGLGAGMLALIVSGCGIIDDDSGDGPERFPVREVDLQAYVSELAYAERDSGTYVAPTVDERADFQQALELLRQGELDRAAETAEAIDYELVRLRDRDETRYDCLREAQNASRGRGFYCLARDVDNPHHLSVPHPLYDEDTNVRSIDVLRGVGFGHYSLSTTHRCASTEASPCGGETLVCGDSGPYRVSDMAHVTESFFQTFTQWVHDTRLDSYHVQLHGCQAPFCPEIAGYEIAAQVSAGTSDGLDQNELVNRFNRALYEQVNQRNEGAITLSCSGEDQRYLAALCATDNTQGRYINGSSDACTVDAPSFEASRFLHVEQSENLRRPAHSTGGEVDAQALIDALNAVL